MGSACVTMGELRCVPLLLLLTLTALIQSAEAKICWEECSKGSSTVQFVNIEGCRRSSYPKKQNFRCSGQKGPPCMVKRGDTVHLDVKWANPGVANMTQSTVWVTSFMDLPWVGMDTQGCPFVDWGKGCGNMQSRESDFYFPIKIEAFYPPGRYPLKWKFWEENKELACFLFNIKIV